MRSQISLIVFSLSIFLYVITSNISLKYHQKVVPFGDPVEYSKVLMSLIDLSHKDYFLAIKSVFTSEQWYWLYKLPVALLSPFLSKEPSSLCLINYLFMAIGTLSFFRVTRRLSLSFNATLLLSLSLWVYPWVYGLQHEMGLFNLRLEATFYWILVALAAHMIVYVLEPKNIKNAVYAGVFTGLAVWGRGNSLPYVLIVLAFPGILILYRLFKTRSNRKRIIRPLTIYFLISGILLGWYYLINYQGILKYYGDASKAIDYDGGYFTILINEFEIVLNGGKLILFNFPGVLIFLEWFTFWVKFLTVLSHILVLTGCVLAFKRWKKKRTKENRLLALCNLTGGVLFYGMLLMGLLLFSRGYGHGWFNIAYPFRLMLIGLTLNVLGILTITFSNQKVARVIQNPMFVPTACLLLVTYGIMMSKVFTPFPKDKNIAPASDMERFALNLENTLQGGNLGFLWFGGVYSTSTLRYYRLKASFPPPNLFYSWIEERPLIQQFPGNFEKHSPVHEFKKILEKGIKKADYLIIPEDIKSFDFMPGQLGLALRRNLLADVINSPDSPKFGVKMILHGYSHRNIRLLLLKRLRQGKNPENLDLLKLPYGKENAVYPQSYPKAGSDIYQPRPVIPFGPRHLFDQSLHTFWEPQGVLPMKEWVEIHFESKRKVAGYNFRIGSHLPEAVDRMPVSWELQASNDGNNWQTVNSHSDYTQWSPEEKNTFWIKKPEEYYRYRFIFTKGGEVHEEGYILRMYEVELLEKGPNGKASEIDSSHFDWYEKRSTG